MFQELIFVGRLGRDPEMRYLQNGDAVTNMSVAVSEKWTGSDGEKRETTTWYRVSAFGRSAEACNQYLRKGSVVLVKGKLQVDPDTGGPRVYEKRDGGFGASFEVRSSEVRFLPSASRGDEADDGEVDQAPVGNQSGVPF